MRQKRVIVVGGGPAGIGASIAAARAGVPTTLIEKNGYLGGMTTAGLVSHWDPVELMNISGIAMEFYDELKNRGGIIDFPVGNIEMPFSFWEAGCGIDVEIYKEVVHEYVERAGVDVRLHSFVTGVKTENRRIVAVEVVSKSGSSEIEGDFFVDATGDGDLAAQAGCSYVKGSEDGQLMACTLSFTTDGADTALVGEYLKQNPDDFGNHPRLGKFLKNVDSSVIWQGFNKLIRKAQEKGDLSFDLPEQGIGLSRLPVEGQFHVNAVRAVGIDGTKVEDLTRAELDLRKKAYELFRFMRSYIPGFENAYVSATAPQIGIRETRRIEGEYLLTVEDVESGRSFDDAVFRAKWGHSDVHSGKDMKWEFKLIEGPYELPYRTLVAKDLDNLGVAGRTIWVERPVIGSLRIQPMCIMTGQVCGAASALAIEHEKSLKDIPVPELQEELSKRGMDIPRR